MNSTRRWLRGGSGALLAALRGAWGHASAFGLRGSVVVVAVLGCAIEVTARHSAPIDAGVVPGDAAAMETGAPVDGPSPCTAQEARPAALGTLAPTETPSEVFLWRWTGLSCVEQRYPAVRLRGNVSASLPPRGCEGRACASLFRAEVECANTYQVCGARVEIPRRGPVFSRAATSDIACGALRCEVASGCFFGVVPGCGSPDQGRDGAGLRCDDSADCAPGTTCCVSDNGAYVVSWCRATCDTREVRACSSDADCAAGASCCQAAAHLPSVATSVGVCTPRRCDPASQIDI